MSLPKKLTDLVAKNNAAGVTKFLRARKTPLAPGFLLPLFSDASEEVIQQLIEVMMEQKNHEEVLTSAMSFAPETVPTLLAAGVPISAFAVGRLRAPDHIALFLKYGWNPATLPPKYGWESWSNESQDFHATVLQAGATLHARDLAFILHRRFTTYSKPGIEREHLEMLLSHVPKEEITTTFDVISDSKSLSDAALLHLPVWILEFFLDHGAPAPTTVTTPQSPDPQEKAELLSARGLAAPAMTATDFIAAHNYAPEDAVNLLTTDDGLLGLRLGMTEADVRALGLTEDKYPYASLDFKDGAVSRVHYHTNNFETDATDKAICNALTERYGKPALNNPTRTVWETPTGRITRTFEYVSTPGYYSFTLTLEPGKVAPSTMPTDLTAFAKTLLDYLKDIGPDVFDTQVKDVRVKTTDDGLFIVSELVTGDVALLDWNSGPLSTDGQLDDEFSSALVAAVSDADSDY